MELIRRINKWSNHHFSMPMNVLRMALGIFIFFKGLQFLSGTEELVQLIQPNNPGTATLFLAHYVAMAHLAGGVLVFFGLITRLTLLIQLPIFIGALTIHLLQGAAMADTLQALIALVATLVFIVYGSGRFSVDKELEMGM